MPGPLSRLRRDRVAPSGDGGFTLVEMLVAMTIFTVVVAVTGVAIVDLGRSMVTSQAIGNSTTPLRQAFLRLDRTLPYATSTTVSSDGTQLSFARHVDTLPDHPDQSGIVGIEPADYRCQQYQVVDGSLRARGWFVKPNGDVLHSTPWVPAASGLTNTSAAPPFADATTSGSTHQSVRLTLHSASGSNGEAATASTEGTFVARNSATDGSTEGPTCATGP